LALADHNFAPFNQRLVHVISKRKHEDFVQAEAEMAIQLRAPIIPVLVNGAFMPSPRSVASRDMRCFVLERQSVVWSGFPVRYEYHN
jgi:1-acyl-sn-glycerol-3-phosphate acyltransferase